MMNTSKPCNPEVSIIIPTYNHGRVLEHALKSVQSQNFSDWECIIVDDGSQDDTSEIVKRYLDRDPRFKYVYQQNKGLAGARNTGIRLAGGNYLQLLDADDTILPAKIEAQLKIFRQCGSVDIVACRHKALTREGTVFSHQRKFVKLNPSVDDFLEGNPFAVHALLIRKNCFDETGFFDETLRSCEDWDMWLRMALRGFNFCCHNDVLVNYYRNDESMRTNARRMSDSRIRVITKFFADLEKSGKDHPALLEKKRAFKNVFMKSSWDFYSRQDCTSGRSFFMKAAVIDLRMLCDFKTYFRFFSLFKPFDSGNTRQIDRVKFEAIKQEIYRVLDLFFRTVPNMPRSIRSRMYRNAMLGITLRYFVNRDVWNAILFFMKSVTGVGAISRKF